MWNPPVVNVAGQTATDDLIKTLKTRIREGASPRHVPKHIVEVPDIPYTRRGNKVELAVARLVNGSNKVDNRDALGNPEALPPDTLAPYLKNVRKFRKFQPFHHPVTEDQAFLVRCYTKIVTK